MSDRTTDYARQVAKGSAVAGPHVRDQCERHLRDLKDGRKRGLSFDVEAAERAIRFFPLVLRLNGGEFEGQPFELLDWQAFIVGSLFGWKKANGYRRFRVAFVLTAKGSGKSPLAAGIGHYLLVADKEPGAEVYAAARMRDQALVLFRDAVSMVKLSPFLSKRLEFSGGPGKEYNIAFIAQGAFFKAIASGDGQSGPRPHGALLDEVHEHPDNSMVELLTAGTKGRRQALIFMITNAEATRESVCFDYRQYAAKVCRGEVIDDQFFAYVAALDEGDDPFADESCWGKPNPSLGVTIQPEYLRAQVTAARGMPSKEAIVRRLNFCEPTDSVSPWIDRDLWEAAEARGLATDLDELVGLPCYAGLDLSSKRDLTALAVVWVHSDGRRTARVWFWTPGDTIERRAAEDHAPYPVWRDAEMMFAPPGRTVDKGAVAVFLGQFAETHRLEGVAFDQHLIDDFQAACEAHGVEVWIDDRKPDSKEPAGSGLRMIRHGQGFAGGGSETTLWMPRSIGGLEDGIIAKVLDIVPNPCLRWNSSSAVLLSDPAGNRKWDKKKSTGRIDGMLAITMADGLAVAAPPMSSVSIFSWDDEWDDVASP